MKKAFLKKLGAVISAVSVIGTFSLTAFASDCEVIYDYQIANDGTYDTNREDYIENISYISTENDMYSANVDPSGLVEPYSATVDFDYSMNDILWGKVKENASAADILITRDCTTLAIDHGHAALSCGDGKTVEHYGPKSGGLKGATGLSVYADMAVVWRHCKTLRIYECDQVVNDTPKRGEDALSKKIVDYAKNNLVGWEYAIHANRRNETYMNCATLIWKAYYANDIEFQGYWADSYIGGMFMPSDFVIENSDKLSMKYTLGWGHTKPYVWGEDG
ncbi:MAG: hypothetical protein OSJ43_16465 [Oscillospiraceae bacterium]|nr:hypothetical protein [Oscillospiraceae bacterium]